MKMRLRVLMAVVILALGVPLWATAGAAEARSCRPRHYLVVSRVDAQGPTQVWIRLPRPADDCAGSLPGTWVCAGRRVLGRVVDGGLELFPPRSEAARLGGIWTQWAYYTLVPGCDLPLGGRSVGGGGGGGGAGLAAEVRCCGAWPLRQSRLQ